MIKYSVLCLRNKDPHKIIAKAIRDIEGLSWNHVEILRHDTETGEKRTFGAKYPESRTITLDELLEHYEIEFQIPLVVKVSIEECDKKLYSLMGKKYSQLQFLLISFSLLWKSWLPFVKPNLTNELICTEVIGEFLIDCCKIALPKSQEMLTLRDIWSICVTANIQQE